ncbi:hypothetical protein ACIF8T_40295 [Streptomyces sp. NPDC085946]|uniref:hypothetical protein n=1 Tax=Streptomyces sp. NPDC085946 TaxID=3365744 RepID=UPI0037CE311F
MSLANSTSQVKGLCWVVVAVAAVLLALPVVSIGEQQDGVVDVVQLLHGRDGTRLLFDGRPA